MRLESARRIDDVVVPDLVVQRTRHGHNDLQRREGANERGWRAIYAPRAEEGRGAAMLPRHSSEVSIASIITPSIMDYGVAM